MTYLSRVLAVVPSEIQKGKVYYHGTRSRNHAYSILHDGIKAPDIGTKKAKLTPVKGRVYLTTDLEYAIAYALGTSDLGKKLPDWAAEHGYLFCVKGSELIDIQPDEDIVGEILHRVLNDKQKEYSWLSAVAQKKLTEKQIRDCKEGLYSAWAQSGKKLLKSMSDSQKKQIMEYKGHIAHEGTVKPFECWKFANRLSERLKPDGSNFFKLATKITLDDF